MPVRLYLAPMEHILNSRQMDVVRVKYYQDLGISPIEQNDYGNELTALLAADVDAAQHAALIANADVSAFPIDLNTLIGANVATVKAALDAKNVPSDDVGPNVPYRFLARWLLAMFSITTAKPLFTGGVTLDTTLGQLTAAQRAELKANAESAGYSTTGLTLQSTIRQALRKAVANAGERYMLGLRI